MDQRIATIRGGVLASLTMDVAQWCCDALFERRRDATDLDEETEAVASVVDRLTSLLAIELGKPGNAAAGRAVHYGLGAAFALGYARVRERWPQIARGNGAAFGVGLFLASDVVLIPLAHLGRSWFRYSRAERFNALASHVVYAMTLEFALQRSLR